MNTPHTPSHTHDSQRSSATENPTTVGKGTTSVAKARKQANRQSACQRKRETADLATRPTNTPNTPSFRQPTLHTTLRVLTHVVAFPRLNARLRREFTSRFLVDTLQLTPLPMVHTSVSEHLRHDRRVITHGHAKAQDTWCRPRHDRRIITAGHAKTANTW